MCEREEKRETYHTVMLNRSSRDLATCTCILHIPTCIDVHIEPLREAMRPLHCFTPPRSGPIIPTDAVLLPYTLGVGKGCSIVWYNTVYDQHEKKLDMHKDAKQGCLL